MPTLPPSLTAAAPLLFVLLWSTGFIGAKFGLPYAEPLTFLSARYGLVIALMAVLALATRARWPSNWRQAVHIGVAGLLVHATYLGGVFMTLHRGLPTGVAALVVGMQPLLTALGAGWLLGERVSARQWAGLALGFIGVTLVVSNKVAFGNGSSAELGWMLAPALAALAGITAGTLYQKRFCPSFDLRTGSVIQFVPCLLVTAYFASRTETMQIDWSGEFVFAMLWLVLVLSLGAISLLNLLIRSGSAVNVASLFYLTPPTTALMAWLLFGETLTGFALAGMVIAVSGVWLARKV
ncbi:MULTISPECIES: DMT family transporter [Aromatoleum]|uniref:EamA family transporter n=2 Tax=Aromatoleum TaxID=551759 RepID=A0ABX1NTD7_9RHOO|nr:MULTISPECIES: DMT family transporter [Aromatoleum]MCK0506438.1 DMT family transporter [Aromatoleum anaerobium]NMG15056.1 EamA family transporter [Aromatoleum bremense]QTQ32236.1 EamA domain-containing protein [Aromatoleum bremense]